MVSSKTLLDYLYESQPILNDLIQKRELILSSLLNEKIYENISEIIVLGSGTSCHAGLSIKKFVNDSLEIPFTAQFPTEFMEFSKHIDKRALVVGLSHSGASYSTYQALLHAKELGLETLALVGESDSLVGGAGDAELFFDIGEEKAVAKTKGYLASITILVLLTLAIKKQKNASFDESEYIEALLTSVNKIQTIADLSKEFYENNKESLDKADELRIVGSYPYIGEIMEATLKLVETVRIPVGGYDLEEFMHGIYNAMTSKSRLIYIDHNPEVHERLILMKSYLDGKTKHQFMIGSSDYQDSRNLVYDFSDSYSKVLEYIVVFFGLCHYMALARGIDPTISGDSNFHRSMKSKKV